MSQNIYPWVVEAVTETIIMVACVKICCNFSLFLICSKSLPSSLIVIIYSISPQINESNSGNRFWYLFFVNLWMIARMGQVKCIFKYFRSMKLLLKKYPLNELWMHTNFIINFNRNTVNFDNQLVFWIRFDVANNFIGFPWFRCVFIDLR